MKALAAAVLAVLGCVGCSGASDAIGSAHGGDPTKGGSESGDAQAAPQSEAGTADEASAADAGPGYCFAAGAVCDPAKGAEPGIACCEGSCSATTGLCSVPADGGVAHQDAAAEATTDDDAGSTADASPTCGPLNCAGCCQGDTCVTATNETNGACGYNGQTCADCGDGGAPDYLSCNAVYGSGPNQAGVVIGGWCCQKGMAGCY